MKKTIFTILILISGLTLFSQDKTAGDYSHTIETKENSIFKYKLSLYEDGTFFFHYYSDIKLGKPPEVNKYGKGKWTVENKVITFFSDKGKDFDEKHTLDFATSKARFITKSPRDKTDQIIKTKMKFLESEISWMKGIDLFKM